MADLDDILSGIEDDEEETEETGDALDFLDDEEEEAPIAPKKTSKKKASKKKVSRKVAPPPEEDEEEAPPPPRKKKVAKKAAAKPAPAPEPEEEAPAPKRRGPKPGVKRGPRKATAAASDGVLASLQAELIEIASGDAEKSRIAQLKADIRTASQLQTQLGRFYAKVEKAVEAQTATVAKLEAELAKLTGE